MLFIYNTESNIDLISWHILEARFIATRSRSRSSISHKLDLFF